MSADVVTADGRARVLADGNEIPLVGLGVRDVGAGIRAAMLGAAILVAGVAAGLAMQLAAAARG